MKEINHYMDDRLFETLKKGHQDDVDNRLTTDLVIYYKWLIDNGCRLLRNIQREMPWRFKRYQDFAEDGISGRKIYRTLYVGYIADKRLEFVREGIVEEGEKCTKQ